MKKQGGHDEGGGGGGGGGGGWDAASTGALFFGIGLVCVGVGGFAAVTGIGAGAAPILLGAGAVLVVVGGLILLGSSSCFVAGTLVSTANGPAPIERIRTGDRVCTLDLQERKLGLRRVVKTFRFAITQVLELGFDDETIACTPRHRFYREGWVAAANLNPGDRLCSGDGRQVELQTVRRRFKLQFVYNFTVEGPHNYLVGKSKLLVHNRKETTGTSGNEPTGDEDK